MHQRLVTIDKEKKSKLDATSNPHFLSSETQEIYRTKLARVCTVFGFLHTEG